MKRRSRSDSALTFALCMSLIVHAAFWAWVLRDDITYLTRQLHQPALVDARESETGESSTEEYDPPTVIAEAPVPIEEFKPPQPPAPPKTKKPTDVNEENIEWGEKNGKGFAVTSAPGKRPLQARQGIEDQSFASRDPEGPELFPDDPSMSTVPPGQNGDGASASAAQPQTPPANDPLAGKGTEGNPTVVMTRPDTPLVPPPPKLPERTTIASAETLSSTPQTSGPSGSQMPSAERRSAASNSAPADQDAPPNERATAEPPQLLPIKRVDVIGIESNKPGYPQVVPALTRPPGSKLSADPRDPLENAVLPNLAAADVASSPAVQTATAAINLLPRQPEEMAQLLGESDPRSGPAITEALVHPPAETDREGGAAPLPELALADRPSAADVLDAIAALNIEEPRLEEMAQKLDQAMDAPVIAGNNGAAGAARATSPQLLASAGGIGGLPGPPMPAADPAPDTGLESDPFAKIPGVEFHDGQVEARSGRQIKPIRPRLSEAGKRDLLAHEFPTILLKVRIDKSGKVTDVKIVRGSGSEAVDMPVYRALWQWWFEPPKDKQGNPLEDVQLVAIHWG